jgi:small subunit ribosomal protein S20
VPNIRAAEKWSRQSEKRSERNRDAKTRLKTIYKKASGTNDLDLAKIVEGEFDKAASKGIIHPNKAARKKARLAKALQKASTSPKTAKSKAPKATKKSSQPKSAAKKTTKK